MQYTEEEFNKISRTFKPAWTEEDWKKLRKIKSFS